ncbi:hypothetical protein AcW1_008406 [Taiwanofungus camphoratus]|nr:hypothetical protein AcV5_008700 [Antrodia cinnamomea]KAI0951344.1 hypothetical protein AcW1_008406 [Antrodia cinnamomea]KAI0956251.1 hypothetical protein AcV7_006696 [Antrodia cinnamomea]
MSNSEYFRRRIGRAPSPITWACYEQIPYDDDFSESGSEDNSCSEDEEDYGRIVHHGSDSSEGDHHAHESEKQAPRVDGDMVIDEGDEAVSSEKIADYKKDVKGKQRAIDPEHENSKRQHRRKRRQSMFTLRPILTIQKSQGFVWNQVRHGAALSISRRADVSHHVVGSLCSTIHQGSIRCLDFSAECVWICVLIGVFNEFVHDGL